MKTMSLMAVSAMITTGAFAGTGGRDAHTDKVLNRIEIQQQQQQNDQLQASIIDQQTQIFDLVKEKEGLLSDLQFLQDKQQKALDNGHTARAARIGKRITWDEALVEANADSIRQYLAVERNDMRLINHNGDLMDNEQAAILRDKEQAGS
ncbi:hypothetical protein F0L74_13295 [Chitinophaga agrisoli]|uniref:Uncharacterized protein n=1 Tax=Chitinophaga agrisoli TaxID=2607653 RepID=A0A5B2VWL0_9BACT|nr:hypothetical protein [Chitinophaga agrisoli]KAA2243465.1 hypothetical protein F0L74_13295 [Chitinophaga agrisoli]